MESGPESRGDVRRQTADNGGGGGRWCLRKYVSACLVCGGLSVCHGVVFVVIYLLLRSYTSSLQFFETIPTYVPGTVFIITGLILMCFAKRKNRYAFLLKVSGGCCVVSALLCVVVTVTTTVVHMNRLQTLHECVYTPQAKTCMCVSAIGGGEHSVQEAHRFVFQSTSSCEVVHGVLYSCLRALFSFSVLGILLCISCSMLVYQLASHEKKRTYWEQLELRRRFLYQRHSHCGCYDELYPWHLWDYLDYRFLQHSVMLPEPAPPPTRQRSSWPHWLPWPSSRRGHRTPAEEVTPHSNGAPPEWRSECIHIFRPPRTSTSGVQGAGQQGGGTVAPRFGPRHHMHHRRTRSNDAVFHHLRYSHPPPPQPYVEIPRYLWGPPPPYSQPDPRPHISEGQIEAPPSSDATVNPASKVSTPLSSERRFDFAIGDPTTPQKKEGDGDTCVVEVHVPYLLPQTDLETRPRVGAFHTLPAPSVKGRRHDLFKSLSSIPRRDLEQPLLQLSVIKACCDSPPPGLGAELSDSLSYPPTLLLDAPSEFRSAGGRGVSRPRGQSLPNLRGSSPSEVAVHFRGGVAPSLKEDSASDHSSTSRGLPDLDLDSSNSEECCDDPFGSSYSDGSAHSSSTSSPPGPVIRGEGVSRISGAANSSRRQALPPPSIILSGGRPATDCPLDCRIRHLHRYHKPDKSEEVRDSGFIVTIKSLDV